MSDSTRRAFVTAAAGLAALPVLAQTKSMQAPRSKTKDKIEVTPTEDLMREHGLLRRALLIYDHCAGVLRRKQALDPVLLKDTAEIIHRFVEDYHEKMEEDYLFPRFRKAHREVELVNTLMEQHRFGRAITAKIIAMTDASVSSSSLKDATAQQVLIHQLEWFVNLYRPHAAREDTVLFPALHDIVTEKEYDLLADQFEDIEHKHFGEHGFEDMVGRISEAEKKFGIYDLAQFTLEPSSA
jgi:hemerythrin-like domain-containing protein